MTAAPVNSASTHATATGGSREIKALAMTGMGGIPEASLRAGMDRGPDFLGCDMGSIDSGAFSLGSGKPAGATERDISLMLEAQHTLQVPLLAGSAGMAGAEPHLAHAAGMFRRLIKESRHRKRLALIHAEIPKPAIHAGLESGRLRPLGPAPTIGHDDIDAAVAIVAQMGPEPYVAALEMGAEIVLAGRSCDTSQYVAIPLMRGYDTGLAFHMAKIIECVSLCAEPGGRDCMLGTLRDDHFVLDSQNPKRRCTPMSVAAHSLYEQPDPYYMYEPGGMLDTTDCVYEAVDDRTTRVSGSRWIPAQQYTIKLEGARLVGYRTFAMAGIRAPEVIANIETIEADVRATVEAGYGANGSGYKLKFSNYGRDGVLGPLEPTPDLIHELFVIIDVVADSQERARAICQQAKQNMAHAGFAGRMSTAGNLAFPFSPNVLDAGPSFEFNVYHLLEVDDPLEFFPIEIIEA